MTITANSSLLSSITVIILNQSPGLFKAF